MRPNAFSNPGKFLRGNIHTHSNLSDGALSAEEVCRRYKNNGYDFLSLTEHFLGQYDYPIADTKPFRDESFMTILGAELHSGSMENGELWHILAVGLPKDFKPSNSPEFHPIADQESGPEIAQRAVDAGAFVTIAHPEWSVMSEADATSILSAHAVEVYNHGSEVECDRGRGLHTADLLLSKGRKLSFIATDDAHFRTGNSDAFGGWVMVKSESNTPEAILEALKIGANYSSMGPDFYDLTVEDHQICIKSSPVSAMIIQGAGCRTLTELGTNLTDVTLPFRWPDDAKWLRVTLIDENGKKAWSNPIWREIS
jgi:hypothetical protein|tara:strand:+ start:2214 stop:3149 length:936 start_codon:yes stop_codon:yes gene_type:complete